MNTLQVAGCCLIVFVVLAFATAKLAYMLDEFFIEKFDVDVDTREKCIAGVIVSLYGVILIAVGSLV